MENTYSDLTQINIIPLWHNIIMKNGNNILGSRIREARKAKGIGSKELCQMLNVVNGTVSRWETGAREPDLKTIAKIAELLNTTVAFLTGETETLQPTKGKVNIIMDSDNANGVFVIAPKYRQLAGGLFAIGDIVFVPKVTEQYSPHCGGSGNTTYVDNEPILDYTAIVSHQLGYVDAARPPRSFHISGNSMADYGVPEDSWVVVNPAASISAGSVCLVEICGNPVIKKLYPKNGGYVLKASSGQDLFASKEDLESGYVMIVGKVVSVQNEVDHRP